MLRGKSPLAWAAATAWTSAARASSAATIPGRVLGRPRRAVTGIHRRRAKRAARRPGAAWATTSVAGIEASGLARSTCRMKIRPATWLAATPARALLRRFGGDYRAYLAQVPRWAPRAPRRPESPRPGHGPAAA